MEVLETLSIALGFATLAGLNLYLTVFITGLAINLQWVILDPRYSELAVLGEPAVLIASGIFFALEFFSDKIPWVDSVWDSVHTLIRPIGGGLLAMHTLGSTDPAFDVIIGLLAGGATLVSHSFKSGTRLAINASPEPFTNIAASVGEDVVVLGGLALLSQNPILAGALALIFTITALYLTPKLFRRMKGFFWMLWHRVTSTMIRHDEELKSHLSADEDQLLSDSTGGDMPEVLWTARVLVGKGKSFRQLTNNTFGTLVALKSDENRLHFVGRRNFRPYHAAIPFKDLEIVHETAFLTQNVVLFDRNSKRKITFRLHSGHQQLAPKVAEGIRALKEGKSTNQEKSAKISKKEDSAAVL